jgi:hypothetical protein
MIENRAAGSGSAIKLTHYRAAGPHDVRLLRPGTVMACTDRGSEAVEEFRGFSHVSEVPRAAGAAERGPPGARPVPAARHISVPPMHVPTKPRSASCVYRQTRTAATSRAPGAVLQPRAYGRTRVPGSHTSVAGSSPVSRVRIPPSEDPLGLGVSLADLRSAPAKPLPTLSSATAARSTGKSSPPRPPPSRPTCP